MGIVRSRNASSIDAFSVRGEEAGGKKVVGQLGERTRE